jgi:hypothetical protein
MLVMLRTFLTHFMHERMAYGSHRRNWNPHQISLYLPMHRDTCIGIAQHECTFELRTALQENKCEERVRSVFECM